jgi:hypothetical protein
MLLSSNDVFRLFKEYGITDAKDNQIVLRWKRNGILKAKLDSRKKGVWFEEKEIKKFMRAWLDKNKIDLLKKEIEDLNDRLIYEKKINQKLVEENEMLAQKADLDQAAGIEVGDVAVKESTNETFAINIDSILNGFGNITSTSSDLKHEIDSFDNTIKSMNEKIQLFKQSYPDDSGFIWATTVCGIALDRIAKIREQLK